MLHGKVTAILTLLVLLAGAAWTGRSLGTRGRVLLATASVLAWPMAVLATVGTSDPATRGSGAFLWVRNLAFLGVLAGFIAVAARVKWEGRAWWLIGLPFALLLAAGFLAGATGRQAFWQYAPLAWLSAAAIHPLALARAGEHPRPEAKAAAIVGVLLLAALDVALVPRALELVGV